jgi:hypothetical protein
VHDIDDKVARDLAPDIDEELDRFITILGWTDVISLTVAITLLMLLALWLLS